MTRWKAFEIAFKWGRLALGVLFLFASSAAGQSDEAGFNPYRQNWQAWEALPVAQRVSALQELMRSETDNPTPTKHDYLMGQYIHGIYNSLCPVGTNEEAAATADDLAFLMSRLAGEKRPEVREALAIALANCGDRSQFDVLVSVAGRRGSPHVRGYAVRGLEKSKAVRAIPELLELLEDSTPIQPSDPATGEKILCYPVRGSSYYALLRMGVEVFESADGNYVADRGSGARALLEELSNTSSDSSGEVLRALFRVGGPEARVALQEYATRNEGDSSKKELVSEARRLSEMLQIPEDGDDGSK